MHVLGVFKLSIPSVGSQFEVGPAVHGEEVLHEVQVAQPLVAAEVLPAGVCVIVTYTSTYSTCSIKLIVIKRTCVRAESL